MVDTLSSGFVVKVQTGGSDDKIKVLLKKGVLYDFGRNGSDIVPDKGRLWRGIIIDKTEFYRPGKKLKFVAHVNGYDGEAEILEKRLDIDLSDKKANGISLKIRESNKQRGKRYTQYVDRML